MAPRQGGCALLVVLMKPVKVHPLDLAIRRHGRRVS